MLEAALLPREVVIEFFDFFTFYDFCHSILSDSDANPEPDPECIPVPLGQIFSVPAVPVSQYWITEVIFKSCEL